MMALARQHESEIRSPFLGIVLIHLMRSFPLVSAIGSSFSGSDLSGLLEERFNSTEDFQPYTFLSFTKSSDQCRGGNLVEVDKQFVSGPNQGINDFRGRSADLPRNVLFI